MAQTVKNLPAMQEICVQSLHWEDPLEKEVATHSNILAWRIHGQRSRMGCSSWGHKESDTTERLNNNNNTEREEYYSAIKMKSVICNSMALRSMK